MRPFIVLGRGNARNQILPGHGRRIAQLRQKRGGIVLAGGNNAAHCAAFAQKTDELTRIDFRNDRNAVSARKCSARCSERQLLATGEISRTTRPSIEWLGRFAIGRIGAVVADLRIGEDHDLAAIGRIGENFLIAGDGGIKDHFTGALDRRTKTDPSKTVPSSRARTACCNE